MAINYNIQAQKWHRDEPRHLSDFCGRPEVFALAKKLGKGKTIFDVGCGEGYFSRKMADFAKQIIGVDLSKTMIQLASEKEKQEKLGINYFVGNVLNVSFIKNSTFELCVGNFITNYLTPAQLLTFYLELARVMKRGGNFILLMPHPVLALTTNYGEAAKYAKAKEFDYIKSRGKIFKAKVKTVKGDLLEIGYCHSTLEDHFRAILGAGLRVEQLIEPVFPAKEANKHSIFKTVAGQVTNMIIVGTKS